jgi:hypothetical protein
MRRRYMPQLLAILSILLSVLSTVRFLADLIQWFSVDDLCWIVVSAICLLISAFWEFITVHRGAIQKRVAKVIEGVYQWL